MSEPQRGSGERNGEQHGRDERCQAGPTLPYAEGGAVGFMCRWVHVPSVVSRNGRDLGLRRRTPVLRYRSSAIRHALEPSPHAGRRSGMLSRREWLRAAAWSVAGLVAAPVLSACGSSRSWCRQSGHGGCAMSPLSRLTADVGCPTGWGGRHPGVQCRPLPAGRDRARQPGVLAVLGGDRSGDDSQRGTGTDRDRDGQRAARVRDQPAEQRAQCPATPSGQPRW